MPWKQGDPEWVPEAYPKMLTRKTDDGTLVPVLYPAGHEKQGHAVIFENEDDEKAYFKPTKLKGKDK